MPCQNCNHYGDYPHIVDLEPKLREEIERLKNTLQPLEKAHKEKEDKVVALQTENVELSAILCAVFSELEKRGTISEVINEATTHGEIDIYHWWEEHKQYDYERLQKELSRFSKHERDVIARILKQEEE